MIDVMVLLEELYGFVLVMLFSYRRKVFFRQKYEKLVFWVWNFLFRSFFIIIFKGFQKVFIFLIYIYFKSLISYKISLEVRMYF